MHWRAEKTFHEGLVNVFNQFLTPLVHHPKVGGLIIGDGSGAYNDKQCIYIILIIIIAEWWPTVGQINVYALQVVIS